MLLNMEAMPTKKKRGPVKRSERERYQALIADDAEWQRPELTTAKKVCELVGADRSRSAPREFLTTQTPPKPLSSRWIT
jgi:hypothetical protein